MDGLLDAVIPKGSMDLIADFASPAPAIVTAELLGVPVADHEQLKNWSADFAEMLGNFQHNPDRFPRYCVALKKCPRISVPQCRNNGCILRMVLSVQ